MSLKCLSNTWVPVVAKQEVIEWRCAATLSGDGYLSRSLTTSINSRRFLGLAITAG
jgi:hypothetical protein